MHLIEATQAKSSRVSKVPGQKVTPKTVKVWKKPIFMVSTKLKQDKTSVAGKHDCYIGKVLLYLWLQCSSWAGVAQNDNFELSNSSFWLPPIFFRTPLYPYNQVQICRNYSILLCISLWVSKAPGQKSPKKKTVKIWRKNIFLVSTIEVRQDQFGWQTRLLHRKGLTRLANLDIILLKNFWQ